MRLWFVHQNFPGQYRHLARYFASRSGCEVVTIGEHTRLTIPGARQFTYTKPTGAGEATHPYIRGLEAAVRRGQEAARLALALKKQGLEPDIVCSHPGWGDTLYFREIFPDAKLLSYFEFYYHPKGADVGFDPEFSGPSLDDLCRVRTKNTVNLLTLDMADWGVCPTKWQAAQFPDVYHARMTVIHDGIDTDVARPDPTASVTVGTAQKTFTTQDEIITYVARNLEPYRGFHIFMRALPELMKRRPQAHVFVIGGDGVSYGRPRADGKTYRQALLEEVGEALDLSRLHFFGRVPYTSFLNVLQVSSVHVYLTYPFVLSWSLMEAMAVGCPIAASRTPPVEEVMTDGESGLMFDFFSSEALAEAVCRILQDRDLGRALGVQARDAIRRRYDLHEVCLPRHVKLVEDVAAGRVPPLSE